MSEMNSDQIATLWHRNYEKVNTDLIDCQMHNMELAARVEARAAEIAAQAEVIERLRAALKPFAGDKMPSLNRSEIGYDRNGLRRCISPMELAMVAARAALSVSDGSPGGVETEGFDLKDDSAAAKPDAQAQTIPSREGRR